MFAKIAAGVLAAIAVTGVGVYVATPDTNCKSCCPLSRLQSAPITAGVDEAPNCCSQEPTCSMPIPQNESLGACTGAATLVPTGKGKSLSITCCSDE